MNKKIMYKGYELIEAIYNKEIEEGTNIEVHEIDWCGQDKKITNIEYKNNKLNWKTGEFDTSYLFYGRCYFKVNALEDNTEEIEELEKEKEAISNPITMMQEIRFYYDGQKMGDKINELVKAVNKLIKESENNYD